MNLTPLTILAFNINNTNLEPHIKNQLLLRLGITVDGETEEERIAVVEQLFEDFLRLKNGNT